MTNVYWWGEVGCRRGTDRDLGAGRGRKRGDEQTWETAADTGTRRGVQSQAVEAGGWRVWTMSRWTAFCAGRGGGEKVQHREVIKRRTFTGGGR